jgi:hypothetical protein
MTSIESGRRTDPESNDTRFAIELRERLATKEATEDATNEVMSRALLVAVGAGQFATHPLEPGGSAVVGRDPGCELRIVHRKISRRHAVIRGASSVTGGVIVEDLGSTNGIFIAGQRLAPGGSAELAIGDSFRLGPLTVVVAQPAPRETSAAPARITILDPTPAGVPPAVVRFAESAINVLIHGETGSGKELLARTIHRLSGRRGPFLAINAAALSDALLESELFGHERGAFTGASRAKPGLLEAARNGTVLLDEIGDMPAGFQAKLLRAIETREVYRVGGLAPIALDVRFVAASHRDLEAEAEAGRFRRDLLYRLDGITLQIAPLRDRRGAIAELARTFLAESAAAAGRPAPRIGVDAIAKLTRYAWPGNVRELRTAIERAFVLCDGDELRAAAIPVDAIVPPDSAASFLALARRYRGNVTEIAHALATSRSQVHRLAQRFGIALGPLRTI